MFTRAAAVLPPAALLLSLSGACTRPAVQVATGIDTSFLRDFAETRGFSCGQPANIELTPDGRAVLFLRSGPRDVIRNLYEMNTATGEVRCLLRAEDILKGKEENLSPQEKARRERMRVSTKGFTWFSLTEDGRKLLVSLSGRLYIVHREDGRVIDLPESPAGPAMDARFSPDGRWVSCVHGYDLYVIDAETGKETALTSGGTEDLSHGVAEFVAQEEMDRRTGYWWSGDSQFLAFEEADQREVEKLYIADARNPESPPQGWKYPRAGGANATVRLGIVSVTGGQPIWVDWDREKYPYLATVRWGRDAPLTIYVQSRDQREGVLHLVDHQTGRPAELLRETDSAWLNIDADVPKWVSGGSQFLWTSERSGRLQLELRNRDGSLVRTLAANASALYGLVALDDARREVILQGSPDPRQAHLYRLSLDGGGTTILTEGVGWHGGRFSRDANVWVETASLLDGTSEYHVRGRDATLRGIVPSVAEPPPFTPALELTTVDAGGRTFNASLIRPRGMVAGQRYPVIASVYGGPGSNMVSASARRYLREQWIADQGFILVSIDGRGTMHRGREWERATAGNLIDIPLQDQAAALTALGARYRELDLGRVGVYGWSFGGYFSTLAVLKRPDTFHCAVAGAPVIDWRDYDTHYTERYMGLPSANPEGYRNCSALTFADQLQRPLLLIHGTTDDNVYFTHTLRMAEALFKAGRPYELLLLPGFTHMVPDPVVTTRLYERIVRFFRRHLVETTPFPLPSGVAG